MRIAITNPTTWPRVRRGAERFLNELAFFLASRGHEVTVIAAKPGRKEVIKQRGYTTVLHRRLWYPWMQRVGVYEFHPFLITALSHLLRNQRFDVVHCCTFVDAYAAHLAKRFTGTPFLFWANALPPKVRYIRMASTGGQLFRRVITGADEVISLSRYMQAAFESRFGRGGVQMPVPVDLDNFKLSRQRDHERPVILCAAALDDARKGGRLLMRAFDRLKATKPSAVLRVSCSLSQARREEFLSLVSQKWRCDVHFLGAGSLEDLPTLYGQAAITVLPSMWEAFGMVIIESMASGTPVVGTRDGAIPEIISTPAVGRLFEPGVNPEQAVAPENVEGLAQAMIEALELSRDPGTATACRDHAAQYSWERVGPQFERVYERITGRSAVPAHGVDEGG